jgi:hypothetical protein
MLHRNIPHHENNVTPSCQQRAQRNILLVSK